MRRYNPKEIEPKWQKIWEDSKIYSAKLNSDKPKYIGFGMFNYPSGAGIHVGHVRNYTIPDVITRVKRQQGFESYQPVGWDSFGLPAENFAIKTGVSPQESTKTAIEKYQKQYRAMGWAVDWEKEINTTDPSYYKWTQWTFLKLFENKLAYQKVSPQWWCPHDKTVLADEQVEAGRCWRCGHIVERKNLKQWFFKITDYADEILEATDELDWTEAVKASQRAWIGKSTGAEIEFDVETSKQKIKVFTTRADTIFSAAFIVLAPEHPLVEELTTSEQAKQVQEYVKSASSKSDLERQEGEKHKTGVFVGSYAINPANNEKIPIWIADFVLASYGTGAVFGDIHDERDFEFVKKFNIPAKATVVPEYIVDADNLPRAGIETRDREVVQCIVVHPSEEKYLLLENFGWSQKRYSFVNGGIEKDEDIITAARRELLEETGYKNINSIEKLGNSYYAEFYHEIKKANIRAHIHNVVVRLEDLEKDNVAEDEKALNKQAWFSFDDARLKVYGEGCKDALDAYRNGPSAYTGEGILIDSGEFSGLRTEEARDKIIAWLHKQGAAKEQTSYKMRDWLISRQRYWGAPIPIIHCPECGAAPVPEKDLPVVLPEIEKYEPTGGNVSVLAGVEDWVNVDCPNCGKAAKRETDTMDGYVCSSWYFMRYLSPHDGRRAWDPILAEKWMPVDFYNGADHATAHLLYARFFARFFHKIGLVSTPEPFAKMVYNGKVKASDGSAFSKSKGNGMDPLEVIEQGYGADALRLYEMFAAPIELDVLWDQQGVPGSYRFLSRIWTLVYEFLEFKTEENSVISTELLRLTHKTIKTVTERIENGNFNTAISAMMELTNELYKVKAEKGIYQSEGWRLALESLIQLVAPFAPHIAEELWQELGNATSVHISPWPKWDESLITEDMVTLAVQINGKVRSEIVVPVDISEAEAIAAAKSDEKIATQLDGKTVKKAIYVPRRLVSLVI